MKVSLEETELKGDCWERTRGQEGQSVCTVNSNTDGDLGIWTGAYTQAVLGLDPSICALGLGLGSCNLLGSGLGNCNW